MPHWLLTLRIDHAPFLFPVYGLVIAGAIYLLVRSRNGAWLLRALGAVALGAAVGYLITWLASDVWDVFGVSLTPVTRMWVAIFFAGVILAAVNFWRTRWWRKTIALVFIPCVALAAAAGINVDYGAYPHLGDALGIVPYPKLADGYLAHPSGGAAAASPTLWQPPAGMPSHGVVGTVQIPGTRSHFHARKAVIYLPPAARVAHPPALPVMMLFAGQPGSPSDVFASGRVASTFDAYAARHHGLAPIVVAADQLGYPGHNPMCADSKIGNVATYLTVDVPNWIRSHLAVDSGARQWAVGGYSEGGTCAIQFGAGHPELFGSTLDVLGELAPTMGPRTVRAAFGGSVAAYDAIKPLQLLKQHAPYSDSFVVFGTGAHDAKYTGYARRLNDAARKAGMSTRLIVAKNSGHDWNTVRYVYARALPLIADRMGLGT